MNNIPSVSVTDAVNKLSDMYTKAIQNQYAIDRLPSVMLWGPPGVGKSQAIRQIADRIADSTGKSVRVTDVRLLLFNPIDLRGIPTSNKDKTKAVWLRPMIFDMDPSEDVINILFMDEISAAPQSVQAAAYQITLDHTVGEHKLPANCIVIAAGNRITDKSVAYRMPKALANRLMHLEIEPSVEVWKGWAVRNGINKKVIGFLSFKPDYLMNFEASTDDLAFATPRAWEMVSNILNMTNSDVDESYTIIAGIIGRGTATEFRAWSWIYDKLPPIEDIFDGKQVAVPKQHDVLYALISAMVSYASSHTKEHDKIANSIKYAMRMPPDFSVVLMRDYLNLEKDYEKTLMNIPEFVRWINTYGSLLNGLK